ncbi:hypothetical protein PTKIN_Ptkin16aG0547100 [Pterospermum kingtungense]
MAAVAGARSSTLNPDAPMFVPAAFRQVEDFSPDWWELVKTSAWFRDYWLSEYQEESFAADEDDGDIAYWLPDSFDIGIDEEFLDLDAQMQEMVESESTQKAEEGKHRNGYGINSNNAKVVLRSLSIPNPISPKEKSPKSRLYFEKAAKCVSPSRSPKSTCNRREGRIQQPR